MKKTFWLCFIVIHAFRFYITFHSSTFYKFLLQNTDTGISLSNSVLFYLNLFTENIRFGYLVKPKAGWVKNWKRKKTEKFNVIILKNIPQLPVLLKRFLKVPAPLSHLLIETKHIHVVTLNAKVIQSMKKEACYLILKL